MSLENHGKLCGGSYHLHPFVISKLYLLVALDDVPAFHRLQGNLHCNKHLHLQLWMQKLQMDTHQAAMGWGTWSNSQSLQMDGSNIIE